MIERTHNYFYKITNLLNGKFYYGIHSTDRINDGYFGGGTYLRKSVRKYGKENFKKEIIADYATRREASDHEKLIVTMDLVENKMCYNLRTGGENEFTASDEVRYRMSLSRSGEKNYFYGKHHSAESKKLLSESGKRRFLTETHWSKGQTKETNDSIRQTSEKVSGANHWTTRQSVSEETKKKMSDSLKGEKHYLFGKVRTDEVKHKISVSLKDKYVTGQIVNPNYGKKLSDDVVKNMTKTKVRVRFTVDGIIYNSLTDAAKHFGVSIPSITHRLKSQSPAYKDWVFLYKHHNGVPI